VAVASLEVQVAKTLRRMVCQTTGERRPSPERIGEALSWLGRHFVMFDAVGRVRLPDVLEAFRYSVRRYGVTQCVLDNLAMLGVGAEDWDAQGELMTTLAGFVAETGAHLHLVAHPRKAHDETRPPLKQDVRGGGVLTDLAHNVFSVWRNVTKHRKLEEAQAKGDPEGIIPDLVRSEPDALWTVEKQKETGDTPMCRLWFDRDSLQYHEEPWAVPLCFLARSEAVARYDAVEPEAEPVTTWNDDADENLPF
jgi:twinkle protein